MATLGIPKEQSLGGMIIEAAATEGKFKVCFLMNLNAEGGE